MNPSSVPSNSPTQCFPTSVLTADTTYYNDETAFTGDVATIPGVTLTIDGLTGYIQGHYPSPMQLNNGVSVGYEERGTIRYVLSELQYFNPNIPIRSITYTFDTPIRAFGAQLYDFADGICPAGTLTVSTNVGDSNVLLDGDTLASNNLLFIGIINNVTPFTEVSIVDTYINDAYSARGIWFATIADDIEEGFPCPEVY